MTTLFIYSLTMAMILLVLVPVYHLAMSRLQYYKINRIVLLLIALTGMSIYPLLHGATPHAAPATPTLDIAQIMAMSAQDYAEPVIAQEHDALDVSLRVIAWIFLAGMVATFIFILRTWIKILYIIYKGEKHKFGPYTIVVGDDKMAPFSFGWLIVMNKEDYKEMNPMILTHEMKHLSAGHTWDLILFQIIAVLNWYNPAAWILMAEIKAVHEYQADKAVLDSGADASQYQLLLIKKAVGTRFPSVANSLNHSKLKKRITMMLSSKKESPSRWRLTAMVPALALALCLVNNPAVANTIERMKSVTLFSEDNSKDKDSESSHNSQPSVINSGTVKKTLANVILDNGTVKSVPVVNQAAKEDATAPKATAEPKAEFTCTGKVTDESGAPIPGVIVKTPKEATVTDANGDFSLKTEQFNVAKIMYVGYETVKMSLTRSNMGTIKLSKSDTDEDYSDRVGGQHCHYVSDTTVVVYVDGVKHDRLDDLNPQDIESMTVVKGDNPKILITTKKSAPKLNGKMTMIVNGTSIDLSEIPEITEASPSADTQIVITDNDDETIIDVETKDGNRTRNRTINKSK